MTGGREDDLEEDPKRRARGKEASSYVALMSLRGHGRGGRRAETQTLAPREAIDSALPCKDPTIFRFKVTLTSPESLGNRDWAPSPVPDSNHLSLDPTHFMPTGPLRGLILLWDWGPV